MPLFPWITCWQASAALRSGRPDRAHALLAPLVADNYRRAVQLSAEVARTYAARGDAALQADDAEAAWRELLLAEALNTGHPDVLKLRTTLTKLALAEGRAAIDAGHPRHAVEAIARLRERGVRGAEFDLLETAAREWTLAAELADHGTFAPALDALERATAAADPDRSHGLHAFAAELRARQKRYELAAAKLAAAVTAHDWPAVVAHADEMTAAAPDAREARDWRRRGWDALGTADPLPLALAAVAGGPATATYHPRRDAKPAPAAGDSGERSLPKRFVLWIDGVGGYLVCLGNRVTLGQASADGPVDVPVFADVARLHAELSRDEEGYVLESGRDVQVNGAAAKRTTLAPGDRLTLGPTFQFVFLQPVPISPTARLDVVSGHRLPLALSGVLLMADHLILGSGPRVHVTLPGMDRNLVLLRAGGGLAVRYDGPLHIDGRPAQGTVPLPLPGFVQAGPVSLTAEPVGPRV